MPAEIQEQAKGLKGRKTATDKLGNTCIIGYYQVSSTNQDTYMEKRSKDDKRLWSVIHSSSFADERAVLITIDEENVPWVVFTVDGGSNDASYIARKHVKDNSFINAVFRGDIKN
jgi:hypothetical protein